MLLVTSAPADVGARSSRLFHRQTGRCRSIGGERVCLRPSETGPFPADHTISSGMAPWCGPVRCPTRQSHKAAGETRLANSATTSVRSIRRQQPWRRRRKALYGLHHPRTSLQASGCWLGGGDYSLGERRRSTASGEGASAPSSRFGNQNCRATITVALADDVLVSCTKKSTVRCLDTPLIFRP